MGLFYYPVLLSRKAMKRQKLSSQKTVIRRLRLSTRLLTLCAKPFRDDNKASRVISLAVWKAMGTAVSLPAAFLCPRPFWDPCLLKQQLRSFSAQWKIATSFKLSRNSARILQALRTTITQQTQQTCTRFHEESWAARGRQMCRTTNQPYPVPRKVSNVKS